MFNYLHNSSKKNGRPLSQFIALGDALALWPGGADAGRLGGLMKAENLVPSAKRSSGVP